ncbi:hypothetical protein HMPREF0762_00606 [Slackia exigua ATCC 700122]|uniref:Uncharacterized protein n=1 Tax=Slackia exigua (strain ATCC 700122 / DSM 15923 / CIP 105133 / JCM 11022 / KCTC 5966 / S-7) TaxID=649764 RepID=D0WFK7_SLAES|nr:hypothetical protein HMPREF0762_00606 [Slackia exigua ATCC 700122]
MDGCLKVAGKSPASLSPWTFVCFEPSSRWRAFAEAHILRKIWPRSQ